MAEFDRVTGGATLPLAEGFTQMLQARCPDLVAG
jgi:hypothetical protein